MANNYSIKFYETDPTSHVESIADAKEEETKKLEKFEAYVETLIPTGFQISEETKQNILQLVEKADAYKTESARKFQECAEEINKTLNGKSLPQLEDTDITREYLETCLLVLEKAHAEPYREYSTMPPKIDLEINDETGQFTDGGKNTAITELANILIIGNVDISKIPPQELALLLKEIGGSLATILSTPRLLKLNESDLLKNVIWKMRVDLDHSFEKRKEEIKESDTREDVINEVQQYIDAVLSIKTHPVWATQNLEYTPQIANLLNDALTTLGVVRQEMAPELNRAVLEVIKENFDLLFGGNLGKEMTWYSVVDGVCEHVIHTLKYTKEELREINTENWKNVTEYIVKIGDKGFITTEDLEEIQRIALRYKAPEKNLGMRENSAQFGRVKTGVGVDGEDVPMVMEQWVTQANSLAQSKKPDTLFYAELGSLYGDLIQIHPLQDGNGTMAVFALEAIAVIHGREPRIEYAYNYRQRVKEALNGNWGGIALAASKVKLFEDYGVRYRYNKPVAES